MPAINLRIGSAIDRSLPTEWARVCATRHSQMASWQLWTHGIYRRVTRSLETDVGRKRMVWFRGLGGESGRLNARLTNEWRKPEGWAKRGVLYNFIADPQAPSFMTNSNFCSIPGVTYPIWQLATEPSFSRTMILPEPSQLIAICPLKLDPLCMSG